MDQPKRAGERSDGRVIELTIWTAGVEFTMGADAWIGGMDDTMDVCGKGVDG